MSESKLKSYIEEANPILETLLATVLRQDLTLTLQDEGESAADAISAGAATHFSVSSKLEGSHNFLFQLAPEWIPLISSGMLGQEMAPEDEGVADVASKVVSQGYDAVRNQLSLGSNLPEATFDAFKPGEALPDAFAEGTYQNLSFQLTIGETVAKGTLFLNTETIQLIPEPEGKTPAAAPETPEPAVNVSKPNFPDFGREALNGDGIGNFDLLADVNLNITVELGRRRMPLSDVLQLTTGSVIELEKLVGEPLEIFANGRLIAEGEAVVIDEQFGVRITRLASAKYRAKALA